MKTVNNGEQGPIPVKDRDPIVIQPQRQRPDSKDHDDDNEIGAVAALPTKAGLVSKERDITVISDTRRRMMSLLTTRSTASPAWVSERSKP